MLGPGEEMVIGIDIDDTITRHPGFYAFLTRALLDSGHRVVIITFREDRKQAELDLTAWGVGYSALVTSTLEAHLEHGVYEWKAAVCRQFGVEVFFDDDPDVLRHVGVETLCLMSLDPCREVLRGVKRRDVA